MLPRQSLPPVGGGEAGAHGWAYCDQLLAKHAEWPCQQTAGTLGRAEQQPSPIVFLTTAGVLSYQCAPRQFCGCLWAPWLRCSDPSVLTALPTQRWLLNWKWKWRYSQESRKLNIFVQRAEHTNTNVVICQRHYLSDNLGVLYIFWFVDLIICGLQIQRFHWLINWNVVWNKFVKWF